MSPAVMCPSSRMARSNGAIRCPYSRSPPARADSNGPGTLRRPVTSAGSSRSTREAYVAKTTTGPLPAHRASWIGLVVVRTPSWSRTSSLSTEQTATIGARCPTRRQDWALCTIRSSVGTMTRIRPSGKYSRAHAAVVIVLPDPVADTPMARAPSGGTKDLAGNPTQLRKRNFWSTWCSLSGTKSISKPSPVPIPVVLQMAACGMQTAPDPFQIDAPALCQPGFPSLKGAWSSRS